MRIIINAVLLVSGLLALGGTYYWIFPNYDGLLDLSGLEWTFLLLLGMATFHVHARNRVLGRSFGSTCQRVVNAVGGCALSLIAVAGVGYFSLDDGTALASAANSRPWDLTDTAWLQLFWLGTLLTSVYSAAPAARLPKPTLESGLIDAKAESAKQL